MTQLSNKYLQPGTTLSIQWESGANIEIAIHDNYLKLQYEIRNQSHIYPVKLTRTDCNYGGCRTWFICPCCGKRTLKLYLKASKFLCRTCQNLNYISSQKNHDYMAIIDYKLIKKTRRLGLGCLCTYELLSEIPFIKKPKGMHWKTYEKIQDELLLLLSSRNDVLEDILR